MRLPKNIQNWILAYIKQALKDAFSADASEDIIDVMFCFSDHYEPEWGGADREQAVSRVRYWVDNYPNFTEGLRDSDGLPPRHSFFFPADEYREEYIESLAKLCEQGYGEIEVHLHHDNDSEESLTKTLQEFVDILHKKHDVLPTNTKSGLVTYAFIHGNWALNNSRPDGRWCGVNNEQKVLLDTGCYGDFTLPSAPSDTQIGKINSLYYSGAFVGDPCCHKTGVDCAVGNNTNPQLLMVQGPLMLNWKNRSKGLFPKIENGELDFDNPFNKTRLDLWLKSNIHVKGRSNWKFIKVHTHGATESTAKSILGEAGKAMHKEMINRYVRNGKFRLHYVTARELWNIIKAAEDGKDGNPNQYRDYIIKAPARFGEGNSNC